MRQVVLFIPFAAFDRSGDHRREAQKDRAYLAILGSYSIYGSNKGYFWKRGLMLLNPMVNDPEVFVSPDVPSINLFPLAVRRIVQHLKKGDYVKFLPSVEDPERYGDLYASCVEIFANELSRCGLDVNSSLPASFLRYVAGATIAGNALESLKKVASSLETFIYSGGEAVVNEYLSDFSPDDVAVFKCLTERAQHALVTRLAVAEVIVRAALYAVARRGVTPERFFTVAFGESPVPSTIVTALAERLNMFDVLEGYRRCMSFYRQTFETVKIVPVGEHDESETEKFQFIVEATKDEAKAVEAGKEAEEVAAAGGAGTNTGATGTVDDIDGIDDSMAGDSADVDDYVDDEFSDTDGDGSDADIANSINMDNADADDAGMDSDDDDTDNIDTEEEDEDRTPESVEEDFFDWKPIVKEREEGLDPPSENEISSIEELLRKRQAGYAVEEEDEEAVETSTEDGRSDEVYLGWETWSSEDYRKYLALCHLSVVSFVSMILNINELSGILKDATVNRLLLDIMYQAYFSVRGAPELKGGLLPAYLHLNSVLLETFSGESPETLIFSGLSFKNGPVFVELESLGGERVYDFLVEMCKRCLSKGEELISRMEIPTGQILFAYARGIGFIADALFESTVRRSSRSGGVIDLKNEVVRRAESAFAAASVSPDARLNDDDFWSKRLSMVLYCYPVTENERLLNLLLSHLEITGGVHLTVEDIRRLTMDLTGHNYMLRTFVEHLFRQCLFKKMEQKVDLNASQMNAKIDTGIEGSITGLAGAGRPAQEFFNLVDVEFSYRKDECHRNKDSVCVELATVAQGLLESYKEAYRLAELLNSPILNYV